MSLLAFDINRKTPREKRKVKKGEGGFRNSKVLVVFHLVFVATELHPDIIFFQHFLTLRIF